MAVLKDLIVHGPSNFIGTTQFTNLKANKIKATEGIFNKLIATTADFDTMTANNATVVGLLDVKGELHTNSWTNSNIATIEGSFYITPTISCESGTFNYDGTNITLTAASGYSFAVSSLYVNNGANTGTNAAWTAYSEVLITGQVAVGNEKVPLGTIKGRVTSTAPTTSKIIINSLTDGKGGTSNVLAAIGTGSKTFYDIKVSMLKRGNGTNIANNLPIGIFMTAMGQNGRTFIDIYGGNNASSTTVGGGLALPVLRIGNLNGMPTIGGIEPGGYGIYTSNGYFTGTIVAGSGTIGGFQITSNSIHTNNVAITSNADNSIGLAAGDFTRTISSVSRGGLRFALGDKFGITGDGQVYAGGLIMNAGSIYKSSAGATAANQTQVQVGMQGVNGLPTDSDTIAFYVAKRTCTAYSDNTPTYSSWTYPFRVNYNGKMTATSATVTGVIKADSGYIGGSSGWTIASQQLYSGTIGANNSLHLGTKNLGSNTSIADRSGSDWRLTVGSQFGVTNNGVVYAKGAHISGALVIGSGFEDDSNVYTISDADSVFNGLQSNINKVNSDLTTKITQTNNNLTGLINQKASSNDLQKASAIINDYLGANGYIRATSGGLIIGKGDYNLALTAQMLAFRYKDQVMAYMNNEKLFISQAELTEQFKMGNFVWQPIDGQLVLIASN